MFSLEFWIILIAICLIGELLTGGFFLMSLGIGSIGGAIANYMNFDPLIQLIVFVIITSICLVISRPFANKLTKGNPKKVASERLIGREGIVLETINSDNDGMVKISGEKWRAISDSEIQLNEKIIVQEIKGVKLKVKKVEK